MSLAISENTLNTWRRSGPSPGAAPEEDARALADYVASGAKFLELLGPKRSRSPEQAALASDIHGACRALRRRFMALHADWLYDALTHGFKIRRTLRELVFGAAEQCPGLTPTPAQIVQERALSQSEKEGYEIDQALFFHAMLRSQKIGRHIVESALRPTVRAVELLGSFRNSSRLDFDSVLIERRGNAAYLTINNTSCLNAEDDRLVEDLETAVDLALLDDSVSVGVLRGGVMNHPRYAGRRVFSAGINLKALHAGQISFVDFLLRRELGFINKIFRGLLLDDEAGRPDHWGATARTLEKPWIACVDSFAIGGGAQLLLVFDHVIAAVDSYFSLPAAQEGIVPGFSNLRLLRSLGGRKSRQVILSGRKIEAHEPDASLLFDEVVNSVELDAAIERGVQQLGSPAVVANRRMLNLAEEPLDIFLQYAAEFALAQAERLYSPDVLSKIWRK
ncbi:MAG TPA: (3,5-dihydroxyphenyl)acetyl-CoA 1,2-dioxygenase DpgC [Blastocatellia bacterium]|nr:(3,5-dihydroxyphenyl)acetyl-CoA 1,2-dioxygenase DpgC [Blastocatellia bacterium]